MPYTQLGERYLSAEGILECLQQIRADLERGKVKFAAAAEKATKALEAGGGAAAITEEERIAVIQQQKFERMKNALKATIFESEMDDDAVLGQLESQATPFATDYPLLQQVLSTVFSKDKITIDEMIERISGLISGGRIKDWQPDIDHQYHRFNQEFGYFAATEPKMEALFGELVVACRKVCVLIEKNNTPDDMMAYDYAYKLMALLIDKAKPVPSFKHLSDAIHLLLKPTGREYKPYHDRLLDLSLPKAAEVHDKTGWLSFIKTHHAQALPIFSSATAIEKLLGAKAPKTLAQANEVLAQLIYQRGSEDKEFAQLCHKYRASEHIFDESLDYISSGWPKKDRDDIPEVTIQIKCDGKVYIWTKLSASDKRSLILGKITSCCQSIGDHSAQCVKDAVSLPKNGLYVLLRSANGVRGDFKKADGSINDEDYDIIGQSYVWKSKLGNLCLDSVECLRDTIKADNLKDILGLFSQQILEVDTSIKRVTLGTGGKTPKKIFEETKIPEMISQGLFYGDAEKQYLIARKGQQPEEEQALRELCGPKPSDFYECMCYLSELLRDTTDFTARLRALIERSPALPEVFTPEALVRLLRYTPFPILDDLEPIAFHRLEPKRECLSAGCVMWQAKTPEEIINALPLINPEDRLVVIQAKVKELPVGCYAASRPKLLEVILSCLSATECLTAVRDQHGKGLLHHAARVPESLKLLFQHLSSQDACAAVMEKDNYGNTTSYYAAANPESLKFLLQQFKSAKEVLSVLREQRDGESETVLCKALRLSPAPSNLELFDFISQKLTGSQLIDALEVKYYNDKAAMIYAVEQSELFSMILSRLSDLDAKRRFLGTLRKGKEYGYTVLHHATTNFESFKLLLTYLPESERLDALIVKDRSSETVLSKATRLCIANSDIRSLEFILSHLPKDRLLGALMMQDRDKKTPLLYALEKPEFLQVVLRYLSHDDCLSVRDVSCGHAVSRPATEGLQLLESFMPFFPFQPGNLTDKYVQILYSAVEKPQLLGPLLTYLPEPERFAAVMQKASSGHRVLSSAARYPVSLKLILSHLPKGDALDAGYEVFHDVATNPNPESLKVVLQHLPRDEHFTAWMEKKNVMNVYYPKSLELVLEHLPESQRFAVVMKKRFCRGTLLHDATKEPDSLQVILSLLPRDSCFAALREEDQFGKTVLHDATRNLKLLGMILPHLPEEIALVLEMLRKLNKQHWLAPVNESDDFMSKNYKEITWQSVKEEADIIVKRAISIEKFMRDTEGLADPQSIKAFVHALINDKDIEAAKGRLLIGPSSQALFPPKDIKSCIDELDPYWLARIDASQAKSSAP
ncbi:MAG: hypothetical protein EBY16_01540 [Gammaproteobacteria bacterium]|nr:hypothetical protein [Gammaproteobacteria bacterium]